MSRNNFINQNNKKIFEARLQMSTNLNIKINKLSNNNISLSDTTQPYIHPGKINLENYSFNNNISKNKKFKKKNLKSKNNLNKSNIFPKNLKDMLLIENKNSNTYQESYIINNKKIKKYNSKNKNVDKKIGNENNCNNSLNIKRSKIYKNTYNNKEISKFNSMINSKKGIHKNNLIINLKNKKNNYNNINIYNKISKDKIISKYKLINKDEEFNLSDSSIKKHMTNNRIKKEKQDKNSYLKNSNTIIDYKYNGRNIKNKTINANKLFTHKYTKKNIFNEKNYENKSNTFREMKLSKNNSTIKKRVNTITIENKGNKTNINSVNKNNKNLGQISLNKQNNNISRNNIIKKFTFKNVKLDKSYDSKAHITSIEPIKSNINKIYQKIDYIPNKKNIQILFKKSKRNNEIYKDNNGTSTKSNDEFLSENNNNKINESSIEEESGILSMNEIEDIICYNNMSKINKEENFLFYHRDKEKFMGKYIKKINNFFFGGKKIKKNYRESKIKIKKKVMETIDNNI